jgi:hypothetical protein
MLVGLALVGVAACGGGGHSASSPAGGPELEGIGDQQVEPTRSLVLRLTATDADGEPVTFGADPLPPNATIAASTGLFVFTPNAAQAGKTYAVTFSARAGERRDQEQVHIRVASSVPPPDQSPTLGQIGDRQVRVGSTLSMQLHAKDPEGDTVTFGVHPALPEHATYDARTGWFRFTPTADQIGTYPLSFIASDDHSVDTETVAVTVLDSGAACAVTTPTGCVPLPSPTPTQTAAGTQTPGGTQTPSATPADLVIRDQCYTVSAGSYTYRYVNVAEGGQLIFLDSGAPIDFRVSSLLVEQAGTVQAGSVSCPFGSAGGTLRIGLWGNDPTEQGTVMNPTPAAIQCAGTSKNPGQCFDPALTTPTPHYCIAGGDQWVSTDPCNVTVEASEQDAHGSALFEGYGALNFDYGTNYFGYKVLAVSYGGSLQLFGRKGVADADLVPAAQTTCDTPSNQYDLNQWAALSGASWGRLDQDAAAQNSTLTLDRSVDWAPGDQVVVATTDWYPNHSELVSVQSAATAGGQTTLTLGAPLGYAHTGHTYAVPPTPSAETGNPNTAVEMRAPVGLLSRSIVVYSLGDTPTDPFPSFTDPTSPEWTNCSYANNPDGTKYPECFFGGHVIARQGFANFQVQGVEFRQLGQGGRMGHYPVHFHLAKSTDYTDAFVKDCSIWDSMDRFVVVHGTHGVTLARNVGYLSFGHAYYLEDGAEIDNLLCHNLAVSVRGSMNEYFEAQAAQSPAYRFVPPILDHSEQDANTAYGGDTIFPVAFWTMNTWNELVGNAAAGVYGYGSCYWLLGSGLSGPSADLTWTTGTNTPADYAGFNMAGNRQAPLRRFRGNSCNTSAYGLQTTLEVDPGGAPSASTTGFTPADNPYPINTMGQYDRPNISGNYLPIKYGPNPVCTQGLPDESQFGSTNVDYCVTTVIDHFTTSFNRPGPSFASVWLRPMWFAFLNGAVTDQLFGGLTFVTGGGWTQTPPGYFSITKNSVFVGSTGGSTYGPSVCPAGDSSSMCAANCAGSTCPLAAEGIGLVQGGFNPKRLISIYDGPFYADGSIFAETPTLQCTTTPPAGFTDADACQIYSSSVQPDFQPTPVQPGPTPTPVEGQVEVVDTSVGWKQPNGFFYPPAFAFRKTGFDGMSFRHNVIDQYKNYLQGALNNPGGDPTSFTPLGETYVGITPIDFSTILNDLDGTFTGWVPQGGTRTSSVSQNSFFDAPSQDAECQSFGVQTSPYEFVSSVIAPVGGSSPSFYVDSSVWGIANVPAVPIYRQLVLPNDSCAGDQSVCCAGSATECPQGPFNCTRATFMLGGQNGEAPYLTANNGLYYIDTNKQEGVPSCFAPPTNIFEPGFAAGQSYVLYNLFANENTNVTYQLYVGDGYTLSGGQWVFVQPHVYNATQGGNDIVVEPTVPPSVVTALNAGVSVSGGVLQVTFDHSAIADDYLFSNRPDYDRCLPRDICQTASPATSCTIQSQASFLDGNPTDYADYKAAVGDICSYWATATAGRTTIPNTPGNDAADPLFADCGASGCLGYMFTLPGTFKPKTYADAGATLTSCFPSAQWNVAMQGADPSCPTPATPAPGDFCPAATPTPTPG